MSRGARSQEDQQLHIIREAKFRVFLREEYAVNFS